MQMVFLVCAWGETSMVIDELRKQLANQEANIVDYGQTEKQGIGFIMITWKQRLPETTLDHFINNSAIQDVAVCSQDQET